jgi:(R,R)-butanediol dehydrogenase / meso-butanediol dehydrogenase / diacetyl reductase
VGFSSNFLSVEHAPDGADKYSTAIGAGMAEYVVVPTQCIVPLADNLSLGDGALTEPMAVAYNGLVRSGAAPGSTVLVIGAGPIGIGAFLGLNAMGVEQVIVSEPAAERRAAIGALGAEVVLDPRVDDVPAVVKHLTGGLGAQAVIEAAGTNSSFRSALDACAPRGRVVLVANFVAQPEFSTWDLLFREIDLVGSIGYSEQTFEYVHGLIALGHYPSQGWVEHVPFDGVLEAFEELRRGARMKLLVDLPA